MANVNFKGLELEIKRRGKRFMNDLQIKTNSPIRTLINKKHTRNAYTCIIFKEDVHISIVENPRPSYFCATIKTLKQHDEEKN